MISGFGRPDPCHKSTEGTDFWLGFMENRWYQSTSQHYVSITVTARKDADFTITIGPSASLVGTYHVSANNSQQVQLDWKQVEAIGSQNIEDKAVHVTSTEPVNVYAFNYAVNSSDVAVIYPTDALGNEYYTMCYYPHVHQNGRNSEFLIVGVVDNTKIEITPSKVIDGIAKRPASTYEIILNKGQVYQAQSENIAGAAGEGDLTGTYIQSDQPFALFSGALATTVPADPSIQAWDHLYEQMPPLSSWGTEFYTVPLKDRLQDRYRILAAKNNTIVNIEGIGDITLQSGEKYEFVRNYDQPAKIYSNRIILVAQYSQSNSADRPPGVSQNNWDGDPFMIILSPVSQTVNDVTFVAYESDIIKRTYVNIVSRTDQIANLLLDENSAFRGQFIKYKNGLYSYAQIEIPKGTTHRLRNTDPKQGLLATVYGFGGVESFGYGVGFNLDIGIKLGGDTIINGHKTFIQCFDGPPVPLDAGDGFAKYLWSPTNDTVSSIKVNGPGTYSVTASIGECVVSDTVDVVINQPILTLGNDTVICNPDTIQLNAGLGWKNILWYPTGETTQIISPKTSGTYSVQVINRQNCPATGKIKITFDNRPKINPLGIDTLYCGTKSATLNISADKGSYTLERTDTGEQFVNLTASVPVFGSYPFKFTATDTYGCYSDTAFKLGFHMIPTVKFSIDSTKCYHYNLDVSYTGDATKDAARFTWVFGGDTIADGIGIETYTIPLGVNQNKRDLSLKVLQEGCSNADTIKDIKVIPDLEVQIVDTIGCQPFNAEFIAKNSEKVFYDWDFGDGTIRRLDDHPFWTYQKDGYYNVSVKVTTDRGCTNSIVMDSAVYVAPIPTAGFSLDPEKCLDLSNHQISYVGTGDQKDSYYWDLSGFDPEEIIQNPGNTQGPFIFNLKNKARAPITLSVLSKYGCKSDTAKITVKRVPSFSMNVTDNKGCVPLETGFEGIINDLIDQLFFKWDYGDGKTGTGGNTLHFYNKADNKYNITVTALSGITGCSDTLKRDSLIFAYPKPKAEFKIDNKVVYNDKPIVNFSNASSGATSYSWDFGDGLTSNETNPSHDYLVAGYRTVLLEVFNEFVCSDTISHQVLVAFDRIFPPNAFSPNAPNPVDREYRLSSDGLKQEGYHFVIMSRWGDIVFEARNEFKGWDGRMKNGDYAPAGNYVWSLDFTDFMGKTHRQTGTVTLVF